VLTDHLPPGVLGRGRPTERRPPFGAYRIPRLERASDAAQRRRLSCIMLVTSDGFPNPLYRVSISTGLKPVGFGKAVHETSPPKFIGRHGPCTPAMSHDAPMIAKIKRSVVLDERNYIRCRLVL